MEQKASDNGRFLFAHPWPWAPEEKRIPSFVPPIAGLRKGYFLAFKTREVKRSIPLVRFILNSVCRMILFFIGIIEMIVISSWTHVVSETRVIASGLITVVNIFIWYYVLQSVVDNIGNIQTILLYALGCAIGTMLTTAWFRFKSAREKQPTPAALD